MKKEKTCCVICGKEYRGYGNNAEPLEKGRCCDKCNQIVVLYRIQLSQQGKKK